MKKKSRAIAIVIVIFLLVAVGIIYIFSELYNDNEIDNPGNQITDSIKFKKEYEEFNGKDNGNGNIYRALSISDENPFIYKEAKDIVKMMNNNESFVVYFGFGKCPWCRSAIEKAIEVANKYEIDKVYYVRIWDDDHNEIFVH